MTRKPIIDTIVQKYIQNIDLKELTENFSRPCKILFPKIFEKNINMMKIILDDAMIDYKIYFANKATKADIFVKTAKEQHIGVDVSSFQELEDALALGYNPEHIIANGPKDILFLRLCLEKHIMISVDSIAEIQKIVDLALISDSKILLRICPPESISQSRFGITKEELITNKYLLEQLQTTYTIYGLNFHIDTTSITDKQYMIKYIIEIREMLSKRRITIQQIGIGGGFGVQYSEDLGVKQLPKEYPQSKKLYGGDQLDELLHTEISPGFNFKTYLRETMSTLHIEPGRMLLDQCGICIHTIIDKKGNKICIDGNIYSLGSIGQEMAHDPLPYIVNKHFSEETQGYEIYGNLCLEADKIFSRSITLSQNIGIGDLLIFVNTAAYFSDFSDAQPIKHTERKTIIV